MTTPRFVRRAPAAAAWVVWACLLATAAFGVARLQPRLANDVHRLKAREDVFVLPPAKHLKALTLGYTSAVAEMLWAKLLVEYGIHIGEKRAFLDVTRYLDGILALEPSFPALYRFVDTLVVYRSRRANAADTKLARGYLERGIQERPGDPKVWLQYGEFLAFLAPSYLESDEEGATWRREGAEAIMRAVALGAKADRSTAAASVLSGAGMRDAAVRQLQRAYALADDPDMRAEIGEKLEQLQAAQQRDAAERDRAFIDKRWTTELPIVTRTMFLLLGPRSPADCIGPESYDRPECQRSWRAVLPSQQKGAAD